MESWVEANALSIKDKEVKRKSDGRSFTIYTIETDHGEFTTSKREMAEHAFQYLHTPARYLIDIQQNGNFTNNYLQDIAPIPGGSTPSRPALSTDAPSGPAPDPVRGLPNHTQAQADAELIGADQGIQKVASGQGWTEKDLAIYRQTAAKVAGLTSRTPDEFWANVDELFNFFVSGTKP